jgi:hypothetical protein
MPEQASMPSWQAQLCPGMAAADGSGCKKAKGLRAKYSL